MQSEIKLSYEICGRDEELDAWKVFVSLVRRDYGELMSKNTQQANETFKIASNLSSTSNSSPRIHILTRCDSVEELPQNDVAKRKRSIKSTSEQSQLTSNIVQEENQKFLEQLNDLTQQNATKKPKRQVKVLRDFFKTKNSVIFVVWEKNVFLFSDKQQWNDVYN